MKLRNLSDSELLERYWRDYARNEGMIAVCCSDLVGDTRERFKFISNYLIESNRGLNELPAEEGYFARAVIRDEINRLMVTSVFGFNHPRWWFETLQNSWLVSGVCSRVRENVVNATDELLELKVLSGIEKENLRNFAVDILKQLRNEDNRESFVEYRESFSDPEYQIIVLLELTSFDLGKKSVLDPQMILRSVARNVRFMERCLGNKFSEDVLINLISREYLYQQTFLQMFSQFDSESIFVRAVAAVVLTKAIESETMLVVYDDRDLVLPRLPI